MLKSKIWGRRKVRKLAEFQHTLRLKHWLRENLGGGARAGARLGYRGGAQSGSGAGRQEEEGRAVTASDI